MYLYRVCIPKRENKKTPIVVDVDELSGRAARRARARRRIHERISMYNNIMYYYVCVCVCYIHLNRSYILLYCSNL